MAVESQVAAHYAQGRLDETILAALKAAGKDIDRLTAADLGGLDEFHIGGRQATVEFASQLAARPGMALLDIGCGIGGASRYFALEQGCRVSGIDLTEDYVHAAATLSQRLGLGDRVDYQQASATALPFAAQTFDGAYVLHVGMNIADKPRLFAEARRVLKPGGALGVYDIMRVGAGELAFPLPWASAAEESFVARPEAYLRALAGAGFELVKQRNRRDFALEFFARTPPQGAGAPSPLGPRLLMGPSVAQKLANLRRLIEAGVIAPWDMIARAV